MTRGRTRIGCDIFKGLSAISILREERRVLENQEANRVGIDFHPKSERKVRRIGFHAENFRGGFRDSRILLKIMQVS